MLGHYLKTDMKGRKDIKREVRKSSCTKLCIVLRKAGKTIVPYLGDKDS